MTTGDRLVGMMNVHTLNTVPREEWPQHVGAGGDDSARQNLWATPQEPLLALLERLLAADVNQMPVVTATEPATADEADLKPAPPSAITSSVAAELGIPFLASRIPPSPTISCRRATRKLLG